MQLGYDIAKVEETSIAQKHKRNSTSPSRVQSPSVGSFNNPAVASSSQSVLKGHGSTRKPSIGSMEAKEAAAPLDTGVTSVPIKRTAKVPGHTPKNMSSNSTNIQQTIESRGKFAKIPKPPPARVSLYIDLFDFVCIYLRICRHLDILLMANIYY